ncbi:MAG: hypothetical protein ABR591_04405 [Candidatus Velthaea sp.]
MLYAFNIGEARLAFQAAEKADPASAAAYAAEAIADSFDINIPTTAEGEKRGADAVARGRKNAATATDDRALLEAAAQRYDPAKTPKQRFAAYASAIQRYADERPSDGMGLTLAAYATWNAADSLTDRSDALTPQAQTIARDLDAALAVDPDDLGAHHLRIHFWEVAKHPERALPDAEYLARLTFDPGQSHLPHMAGHTYSRTGNYAALVAANEAAIANDGAYFKLGDGEGQRYMRTYHDHDVDFVLYGLTTVGRNAEARALAVHESQAMRLRLAVRLHQNAEILKLIGGAITPERVQAEVWAGDVAAAQRDLASVRKSESDARTDVAEAVLDRAKGDRTAALAAYAKARKAIGTYPGDPKTLWAAPVGEGEGVTLLAAGRPAEAERVFRSELATYPNDPHLFYGLAQALKAQGKDDSEPRRAYQDAWKGDRPLTLGDLG